MIIDSYCGSFPHSLLSSSKSKYIGYALEIPELGINIENTFKQRRLH